MQFALYIVRLTANANEYSDLLFILNLGFYSPVECMQQQQQQSISTTHTAKRKKTAMNRDGSGGGKVEKIHVRTFNVSHFNLTSTSCT